jgi:hypothetical protein
MIVLKIDFRSSSEGVKVAPTKPVPFLVNCAASGGTKPPVDPLPLSVRFPGGDHGEFAMTPVPFLDICDASEGTKPPGPLPLGLPGGDGGALVMVESLLVDWCVKYKGTR